jgi:hypothetical protein
MPVDPIITLAFALRSNRGVYALLLGSGLSSAAGLPTGWDVVTDLVRRVAAAEGDDAGTDPQQWYADKFGEQPLYGAVLDTLAKTPAERQAIVRGYIEPTADERQRGLKLPTKAHAVIAQLVARGYIRVIITTNFDRLVEQALESAGVSFDVIDGVDALAGAQPLAHSNCTVIKLHGDYRDARIKNTAGELERYEPEIEALLDRALTDHGLIVCGWSATWDTALRSALRRQMSRRYTVFWTVRGEPSTEARELISARGAEVIAAVDAERFFTELLTKIDALEDVDRPHPLSVATAVAEMKRYLPDPQAWIRLEDLVMGEAERVVAAVDPALFPAQVPYSDGDVRARIAKYEATVEVLASLLAVGAAYGREAEQDRLWSRALARIAKYGLIESGTIAYMGLRRYPALVCLYAAGIVAVAYERWTALREILFGRSLPHSRHDDRTEVPLIAVLCPYLIFESVNAEAILHPGRSGGKLFTPIGDYLHDAVQPLLKSLIPSDTDYTQAFDRFEFLLGTALADADAQQHDGYIPWGYAGSFAWRYRRFNQDASPAAWLRKQIQQGASSPMLQADLFRGDAARAEAAIAEIVQRANEVAY